MAQSHKAAFGALLVLVLALAACGGSPTKNAAPAGDDPVADVRNALDVRSAFEADAGKARLLVLLAPT